TSSLIKLYTYSACLIGLLYLFSTFTIVNANGGVNDSSSFILFKRPSFFARLNLSSFNCSNYSSEINLGNISFPIYLSSVNILVIPPCDRLIPDSLAALAKDLPDQYD